MNILGGARRVNVGGAPLPYDAEVEYLDSCALGTTTQGQAPYIILPRTWWHSTVSIRFKVTSITPYSNYNAVLGFTNGYSDNRRIMRANNASSIAVVNTALTSTAMDEVVVGTTSSGVDQHAVNDKIGIALFAWISCLWSTGEIQGVFTTYSDNGRDAHTYIYGATVTDEDSGDVVMDLIPVRKDGVGYMYDRVSGELFGNNGTGAFVIGPDI